MGSGMIGGLKLEQLFHLRLEGECRCEQKCWESTDRQLNSAYTLLRENPQLKSHAPTFVVALCSRP